MIKLTTPKEEIDRQIQEAIENFDEELINRLCFIGEQAVNEARAHGDYQDWTGNLRSSVGYVVARDGEVVEIDTRLSERGTDRVTGKKTTETFLDELLQKHNKGFVLIVVAGMNYAVYVEGRGRNVLSSSKLLAESLKNSLV